MRARLVVFGVGLPFCRRGFCPTINRHQRLPFADPSHHNRPTVGGPLAGVPRGVVVEPGPDATPRLPLPSALPASSWDGDQPHHRPGCSRRRNAHGKFLPASTLQDTHRRHVVAQASCPGSGGRSATGTPPSDGSRVGLVPSMRYSIGEALHLHAGSSARTMPRDSPLAECERWHQATPSGR